MATYLSVTHTIADPTEPTLATEGLSIRDLAAVTIVAAVEEGETITSGDLECYVYDSVVAAWVRLPAWDVDLANGASMRRVAWVRELPVRRAQRITWVPATAVASGGTTMVVHLLGQSSNPGLVDF